MVSKKPSRFGRVACNFCCMIPSFHWYLEISTACQRGFETAFVKYRSDRLAHELTRLTGEPQNLVSCHPGKLRDARLMSAQRSSADRHDAYYTLELNHIGSLLRTTSGAIQTFSAGSHPKPVHVNALRVMRDEYGIDISKQSSKHLYVFTGQHFDRVISLCDRVREVCPEFPGSPNTIHWSTRNPADAGTDDISSLPMFQQVASELEIRIGFLLALLTDQPAAT